MHWKKLWLKEEMDGSEAYPLHLKANYQWQKLGETGSRRNQKTDWDINQRDFQILFFLHGPLEEAFRGM